MTAGYAASSVLVHARVIVEEIVVHDECGLQWAALHERSLDLTDVRRHAPGGRGWKKIIFNFRNN